MRKSIRSLYHVAVALSIAGAGLVILSFTSVGTALLFLLGVGLFLLGTAITFVASIVRVGKAR